MLKGIDTLISPEFLNVLAEMGHGDEMAIVDASFPAVSMARRLVRIHASALNVLAAALGLLPLDDLVDAPLTVMEVVGAPDEVPETVREFQAVVNAAEGKEVTMARVERFAFYERASRAFAIIATGEPRFYGCVLVKKGVIPPR